MSISIKRDRGKGPDSGIADVVRPPTFVGSDAALLDALREGRSGAAAALYDRFASYVYGLLLSLLGSDPEVRDLQQEVFLQALQRIETIREADRLKAWLGSVAVNSARSLIRKRSRWRWLQFMGPESLPTRAAPVADEETLEVLRLTFEVLDLMPANERIAFSLRFVEQLELTEVAEACGVSLATAKRRIVKAERRFLALAQTRPPLRECLESGSRWRHR